MNIDMNLPSNSNASKSENKSHELDAKEDGKEKGRLVKKRRFFENTLRIFSGKNIENAGGDVIDNVIIPALWDLLRESAHALIDKVLDQSEDSSSTQHYRKEQVNNGNYIPYGSASASKKNRRGLSRRGDYIDQVYFPSRKRAEEVLELLRDIMDSNTHHIATVDDYCAIADVRGDNNYMNAEWGWNDLSSVRVRHTLDGSYYLDLPKVKPYDEMKGES